MVAHVDLGLVFADTLCCLGLGFLLAAVYDMARFALGNSKIVCFVLDVCAFLLAAILLCSFAASRSFSGVVRWYMAAGLLLGLLGYFYVLSPATLQARNFAKWLLSRPFVLMWILAIKPLWRLGLLVLKKFSNKFCAMQTIRRKKQLKSKAQMLYNSNQ